MARRLGFYLHQSDGEDGLPPLFGVAEGNRRLTVLTKEISSHYGSGLKFEIGTRNYPQYEPTYESWVRDDSIRPDDDDLADFVMKKEYGRWLRHGEVVHIYVYDRGDFGWDLYDTITGWAGTPNAEPVLGGRSGPHKSW